MNMYTIKPIEFDELKGNEYVFGNETPIFAILKEDKVVAYLSGYESEDELMIAMFEVIEKEKGIGTEIVNRLFDLFNVKRIIGYILKEERSYYFWDSLGAEIDLLEDGFTIDELVEEGLQSSFSLTLNN